jgi:hypothetical protein
VIVIQDVEVLADHGHVGAEAITATWCCPPVAGTDCVVTDTEKVQGGGGGGAAACLTVNVWPATNRVPDRWLVAVDAAAEYRTTPLPVPLDPESIASHDV